MAFGRYRGTSSFDSSPTDAGSTILKLTNKILADLQVDNSSSQQAEARVVRNVRSYSDPSGGVDARESLPAYYDTSTILQPARNPNMPYLAPVNTSNELEDFDPLISRSQPAVVAPEDSLLNSQLVESEPPATQVTSELSKYIRSETSKSDNDDDFWAFFDGERHSEVTSTDICTTDKQESLPNDAVTSPNDSESSLTQSNDTKDDSTQVKCVESSEGTSLKLTLSTNTEDFSDDDNDEQIVNTGSRLMATQPKSKPFVARFIKLSPFGSINPELPKVKIIIVGDANTGKSCFLHKYIHGCFDYQSQPTVGVDICSLPLEDKKTGKQFVAQLWDTQGQERFNSLTTTYFRGSHGAIIVYDITNYKSLNNVYNWKSEVEKATSINPFTHIPTVLVGNKLDLAKDRDTSGAKDVADKLDIDQCFEASSKDGRGIDEVVDFLLEQILKKNLLSELKSEQETISLDKMLDKKKCCLKSS